MTIWLAAEEIVPAARLLEGDLLAGAAAVISMYRDVRTERVRIVLDDGAVLDYANADPVVVLDRPSQGGGEPRARRSWAAGRQQS